MYANGSWMFVSIFTMSESHKKLAIRCGFSFTWCRIEVIYDLTQEDIVWTPDVTRQNDKRDRERYSASPELVFKLADFFSITIEHVFISERRVDSAEQEAVR